MSSEVNEAKSSGDDAVAKLAPTEQQESRAGEPKKFLVGQTVCNERTEKGKLCNGHLKQLHTAHPAEMHLRGEDVLHQCQTCGALYSGPPLGHVRDSRKQRRYVEKGLAAILRAAGGTLPAYDYPTPPWREQSPRPIARVTAQESAEAAPPVEETAAGGAAATPKAAPASAASAPAGEAAPDARPATAPATDAPADETPEQKRARVIAEFKAKYGGTPVKKKPAAEGAPAVTDSSPEADRHRPAAEAQAATGQASAAPLSPAAATASPASGAETPSDLAPDASTELTPGAPPDERAEAPEKETAAPRVQETDAPAQSSDAPPTPKRAASVPGQIPPPPPHLMPPPGETHEEKIARLKLVAEEAKRKAGKL